ncbi:MAG: shikimate dehydrogenase [Chloroflexi bacterium]|nr:MAG: shikimate dehydrogenase [Chloroflexota bacterium]
MRIFLLGHGISYSRSPAMQFAAFRAAGLDWTYDLLDVPPDALTDAIKKLRAPDAAGANVTIPYKLTVMEHLDRLDADALRAHAVNTISRDGEHLVGSNTDVAGIRSALEEVGLTDPRGAKVVVLGVGGSARAAGVALEGAHMTFIARHPDKAGELPGHVAAWFDHGWESDARAADLLLNATPLGRREEMPLRPNALPKEGAVVDLVYVAGGTPLVRKARSLGLRTADGWGVLVAQGARSFEIWTGKPAPVDAMREALTQ